MTWAFLDRPEFSRVRRLMSRTYQAARQEPRKRFDFDNALVWPALYDAAKMMFRQSSGRNTPGPDGLVFDEIFDDELNNIYATLIKAIATGAYTPDLVRRIPIKQGKKTRWIVKQTVREALLDRALLVLLLPVVEADLPMNSYGFRPGIGAAHALSDIRFFLNNCAEEAWFIRADITRFFDEIPHARLFRLLRRRLRGGRLLHLLEQRLRAWARVPGRGLLQGAPLSPVLANWFLLPLDRFFAARSTALYCRYADDLLIVGTGNRERARTCQDELASKLKELGLRINSEKSWIASAHEGTEYLGGRITINDQSVEIHVTEESLERLKRKIAEVAQEEPDRRRQKIQLQSVTAGWVGAHRFDAEAGQRAQEVVENTTGLRLVWNNRRRTTSRPQRRTPLWMKPDTQRERDE